jgi:protease-4
MLEGVRKVLHLVLLLVIFGFMLAALHTSRPGRAALGGPGDRPRGRTGRAAVQRSGAPRVRPGLRRAAPETLLRDVIDAIEAAKIRRAHQAHRARSGQSQHLGLSKLQEIGAALRDFRAAGKRVVVAADSLDQTQYYLAAQAGEVYLDPLGLVYVDGFSYYRMFLKDAIDKLGVDVNVFRAGTFKSFTDSSRAATWRRASARRVPRGCSAVELL